MNFLIGETNGEKVRKERTKYIDESQEKYYYDDYGEIIGEVDNTDTNWEDEEDENTTD